MGSVFLSFFMHPIIIGRNRVGIIFINGWHGFFFRLLMVLEKMVSSRHKKGSTGYRGNPITGTRPVSDSIQIHCLFSGLQIFFSSSLISLKMSALYECSLSGLSGK
jgi:hypothetical protein